MEEQKPTAPKDSPPSEDEWRTYMRELRNTRRTILRQVLDDKEKFSWFGQKQKEFWERLRTIKLDHDEVRYLAYHVNVGGSSTGPDYSPYLDFPEEYSVKKYYEKLIKELEEGGGKNT